MYLFFITATLSENWVHCHYKKGCETMSLPKEQSFTSNDYWNLPAEEPKGPCASVRRFLNVVTLAITIPKRQK